MSKDKANARKFINRARDDQARAGGKRKSPGGNVGEMMAHAGGTPGFYSPGGPGRSGGTPGFGGGGGEKPPSFGGGNRPSGPGSEMPDKPYQSPGFDGGNPGYRPSPGGPSFGGGNRPTGPGSEMPDKPYQSPGFSGGNPGMRPTPGGPSFGSPGGPSFGGPNTKPDRSKPRKKFPSIPGMGGGDSGFGKIY